MNANDMCKCGHTRAHHKFMGGISMCYAVVARHPEKKLCDCRKFEPDE